MTLCVIQHPPNAEQHAAFRAVTCVCSSQSGPAVRRCVEVRTGQPWTMVLLMAGTASSRSLTQKLGKYPAQP